MSESAVGQVRVAGRVRRLVAAALALVLLAGLLVVVSSGRASAQRADGPPQLTDRAVTIYRYVAHRATCEVDWLLLAGIAGVVSDHGRHGQAVADTSGLVQPPIVADPSITVSRPDTDGGVTDGDPQADWPVGPFQFLPEVWAQSGRDGNGDRVADPHNLWDAATAATVHLCAEGDAAGVGLDRFVGRPELAAEVRALVSFYRGAEARPDAAPIADSVGLARPVAEGGPATEVSWYSMVGVPLADPALVDGVGPVVVGDFDGDGRHDVIVEPGTDVAGAVESADGSQGAGDAATPPPPVEIGTAAVAEIVVGDWNGDGLDDRALLERSDGAGQGHLVRTGPDGAPLDRTAFVVGPADQVVVGDWDGDGVDQPGIWRSEPRADGTPSVRISRRDWNGYLVGAPVRVDVPAESVIVGDWNGDGAEELGVWWSDPDAGTGWLVVLDERDVPGEPIEFGRPGDAVFAGSWQPPAVTPVGTRFVPLGGDVAALVGRADVSFVGPATAADGTVLELWNVSGMVVDASVAVQVAAMVDAAAADGVILTGWGFRTHERQWELRAANCPDAAASPASACSPPTAVPGSSRHEFGVAIDFHVDGSAIGTASAQFAWLSARAAEFGFFNLPSEPWHWSIDGG